jgi:hypothetical protein
MIGDGDCGKIGGIKPKSSERTCPSAIMFTTNPTWLDPGLNPGRRGGKPATNRLSYGVFLLCMLQNKVSLEHMLKMGPSSMQAHLYASLQIGEDIW